MSGAPEGCGPPDNLGVQQLGGCSTRSFCLALLNSRLARPTPGLSGQREPCREGRPPKETRNLRVDVIARGTDADSTLPKRVGTRILRELRGALPPTIFFFLGFHFILLTTNLLVANYAVAVSNFMLATVAALVVGKAVITANALPFIKLFDRAPLIQPILFKTAIYWVATFIARLAERFVHFWVIEGNRPGNFADLSCLRLFMGALQRGVPLDTRALPDLRYGVGIQPALRSSGNAEVALRLQAVRTAIEPPPARSRTNALEPARR